MSTSTTKTNNGVENFIDRVLENLENGFESGLDQESVEIEEEIGEEQLEKEERFIISKTVSLGIRYKEGKLVLTDAQEWLLRVIFKGRMEMISRNAVLGEALMEVLRCKTREEIEEEVEWWT